MSGGVNIAREYSLFQAFLFGDSKAKKFYRRVLPKAVFGTFESADDNEDFKAFAAAVGK